MKTAKQLNMVACHYCAKVWQFTVDGQRCMHCNAVLHQRKPKSLERCWAYLIAACVMYLPANLMPIMVTNTLFMVDQSTIMEGVILFWVTKEYAVAIIIFIASFVVPILKIVSLFLLLISIKQNSIFGLKLRTRLYQTLEFIGRWSMLDVFVVALMVGLVQIKGFASIEPGLGMIAFGAVVVLTMLASLSFDPKLIWDAQINNNHKE
jgi:paraquat-inducible protein A